MAFWENSRIEISSIIPHLRPHKNLGKSSLIVNTSPSRASTMHMGALAQMASFCEILSESQWASSDEAHSLAWLIFYCRQKCKQCGMPLKNMSLAGRWLGCKFWLCFVQLFLLPPRFFVCEGTFTGKPWGLIERLCMKLCVQHLAPCKCSVSFSYHSLLQMYIFVSKSSFGVFTVLSSRCVWVPLHL